MMTNAETLLSDDDRAEIEEAVAEAEGRTAAELVCAVATESDRYDRSESIAGLGFGLIVLGLVHAVAGYMAVSGGSWETAAGVGFAGQVAAVVGGFVVGSVLTSYWHGLRRMLVSEDHLTGAVEQTGWRVFGMHKIRATERRTGILIYVSLFEHRVSVLADDAVREVLGDEGIAELRDIAVDHLRDGRPKETFLAPIRRAAELLEDELPAGDDDVDELDDRMLVFHPRPE